jgi:hypothetical protein
LGVEILRMQNLAYISTSFQTNNTFSYNLSIQCDLNGLSFSVIDTPTDQCLVLKHIPIDPESSRIAWEDRLKEILDEEPILSGSWKQVRIIWSSRKSLMIPSNLFKLEDLRSYLVLHQMLEEYDEIHYIKLQSPDSWVVFPVPSSITQMFIRHFPGALFYHQSVPFLDTILRKKGQVMEDGLHLSLHHGFFDYALIRGESLESFNSFAWKDSTDILYLVLYLFKQFELSPKHNELVIYGMAESQSETMKLLRKYFANTRTSLPDERLNNHGIDRLESPQLYTNLLNLYFCVS